MLSLFPLRPGVSPFAGSAGNLLDHAACHHYLISDWPSHAVSLHGTPDGQSLAQGIRGPRSLILIHPQFRSRRPEHLGS